MSLEVESAVGERLKFGEFELAPVARALWRRGKEVKLGSRATLVGIEQTDCARDRLREILNRISEGLGTRDYRVAVASLGRQTRCSLEAVELATLEWASRFNNYRLMAPLDDVPPVELEANDYHSRNLEQQAMPA